MAILKNQAEMMEITKFLKSLDKYFVKGMSLTQDDLKNARKIIQKMLLTGEDIETIVEKQYYFAVKETTITYLMDFVFNKYAEWLDIIVVQQKIRNYIVGL